MRKEKNEPNTYSNDVIEIAKYKFSHPSAKRCEILRMFEKKWGITRGTFDRKWKEAKEYEKTLVQEQEKASNEELASAAKKSTKNRIIERERAEVILSEIAEGVQKTVVKKFLKDSSGKFVVGEDGKLIPAEYETIIPNYNERISAIGKLSQMKGWDAATKVKSEVELQITGMEIK